MNTYIITFLELQWHVISTFTHPKANNEIMPSLDKNKETKSLRYKKLLIPNSR